MNRAQRIVLVLYCLFAGLLLRLDSLACASASLCRGSHPPSGKPRLRVALGCS